MPPRCLQCSPASLLSCAQRRLHKRARASIIAKAHYNTSVEDGRQQEIQPDSELVQPLTQSKDYASSSKLARNTLRALSRPVYNPARYDESIATAGAMAQPQTPRSDDPVFKKWFETTGDRGGARFGKPSPRGPTWLGNSVPFPTNPSFKPPPPLSDLVRTLMATLHFRDPAKWTVRKLSSQFVISVARTEAVLRLKGLELEFQKQGKPLQSGFLAAMERHLLSHSPRILFEKTKSRMLDHLNKDSEEMAIIGLIEEELSSRVKPDPRAGSGSTALGDSELADLLDQEAREDGIQGGAGVGPIVGIGNMGQRNARGIARTIWEDIREGEAPVAAELYYSGRKKGLQERAARREAKAQQADYIIVKPMLSDVSKEKFAWKFVNVKDKFVIPRDEARRVKARERRGKKAASRSRSLRKF